MLTELTADTIIYFANDSLRCTGIDKLVIQKIMQERIPTDKMTISLLQFAGSLALIRYDSQGNCIIISRDIYGRQSLLFGRSSNGFVLSLCKQENADVKEWFDVPHGSVTIVPLKKEASAQFFTVFDKGDLPEDIELVQQTWIKGLGRNVSVIRRPDIGQPFMKVNRDSKNEALDRTVFSSLLLKYLCDAIKTCLDQRLETLAVCFSGGIDSLLVAYIADMVAESDVQIDLIAVAFGLSETECDKTPDRIRGRAGFEELKRERPLRRWNFIRCNVSPKEVEENRERISRIVQPCQTILDESLGSVLWFALRGAGIDIDGKSTRTSATYFMVGSGADELCAGYSRHRHRFEKDGAMGLADELEAELIRYGTRNGSRDARVAIDHQRIIIAPFFDGNTAAFCNRSPLDVKCDLDKPRGIGEKAIIREALKSLGSSLSSWPKQAMQFGSKFAQMQKNMMAISGKDIKGSDMAQSLRAVSTNKPDSLDDT